MPTPVLATIIFIFTELMFFAGLFSAHTIAESSDLLGWPPLDQPRLPIEETALNTLALLASGALVGWAGLVNRRGAEGRRVLVPLALGIALGAYFVFAQGVEWTALIHEGLTLTSNTHGSFFYLIVGSHAVHALAAIVVLGCAFVQLARGRFSVHAFSATQAFWFFVVGVWPVLYLKVYL